MLLDPVTLYSQRYLFYHHVPSSSHPIIALCHPTLAPRYPTLAPSHPVPGQRDSVHHCLTPSSGSLADTSRSI